MSTQESERRTFAPIKLDDIQDDPTQAPRLRPALLINTHPTFPPDTPEQEECKRRRIERRLARERSL
jgi:hypothetical protein